MNYSFRNNPQPDRYHRLKCLSIGKIGEVYLVKDAELDRLVVLKLLRGSLGELEQTYKRWKREFELCAAFESKHLVKILDFGITPEGYPFYVMEYLEGESLEQLLEREQRLTVEHSVEIASQVCEGLQFAHTGVMLNDKRVKIVHGNLKLDKIFLESTASGKSIKIFDCGITKKTRDILREYEYRDTTIINIPPEIRYAAPEQVNGSSEIDGRADIYSLGIILYKMLSGTDPYGLCSHIRQVGDNTWAKAHTTQPLRLLRSQPGCEQILPQLEKVVMKCLQRSPDARFATMAELKQALERAIFVDSSTNSASTNSTNTIVPSTLPATKINLNSPTVIRQVIPLEPEVVEPTIATQIYTKSTLSSVNQTIYQADVSPKHEQSNQTIYQSDVSPKYEQSNQTICQTDVSPKHERANQTICQTDVSPKSPRWIVILVILTPLLMILSSLALRQESSQEKDFEAVELNSHQEDHF